MGQIFHTTFLHHTQKFMEINASSLKQFLNAIKYKDFTLIFSKEEYHPKILNDTLPVRFDFKNIEDKIVLYSKDSLPVPLTKKMMYFYMMAISIYYHIKSS